MGLWGLTLAFLLRNASLHEYLVFCLLKNSRKYFDDKEPIPVDCDLKMLQKTMFFLFVIALIGVGIVALIKGMKGRWDQDVKPEDMVGPGGPSSSD